MFLLFFDLNFVSLGISNRHFLCLVILVKRIVFNKYHPFIITPQFGDGLIRVCNQSRAGGNGPPPQAQVLRGRQKVCNDLLIPLYSNIYKKYTLPRAPNYNNTVLCVIPCLFGFLNYVSRSSMSKQKYSTKCVRSSCIV